MTVAQTMAGIKRLHFFTNGLKKDTHVAFVFGFPPAEDDGDEKDKKVKDTIQPSARLVWSESCCLSLSS
jgi:hypothetical protein